MILKSIKLNNIRSYTNQTIGFSTGSTLLSGDIGSGKSTILLSIEFALFGIKPGSLTGDMLLRHGSNTGYIELSFEVNKKDITIKRGLKRNSRGITQEAGYIIIGGIKKEATPTELKAEILDILGYPLEIRSNDVIYRYTVYTPQEDMNKILFEDKDIRLDTFRKVFNLDKYKLIRENTQNFIISLRQKKAKLEGSIADLDEKLSYLKEIKEKFKSNDEKKKEISPRLEEQKNTCLQIKSKIDTIENTILAFNEIKKRLDLLDIQLNNDLEKKKKNKADLEKVEKDIEGLALELSGKDISDLESLKRQIAQHKQDIDTIDKHYREILADISKITTLKASSDDIKKKISKLDNCPMCEQQVTPEHKKNISKREDHKLSSYEEKLTLLTKQEQTQKKQLADKKDALDKLNLSFSEHRLILMKKKLLEEKKENKAQLEQDSVALKKDIGNIGKEKLELNEKIKDFSDIDAEYKALKRQSEEAQQKLKIIELEHEKLKSENELYASQITKLKQELEKKESAKSSIGRISQYIGWLNKFFIALMINIEKHTMVQILSEFNEFFITWFDMIIEDETIAVRLDDDFTPIIMQNGYETSIANLSGGERTSVALAYRLALNKVINDVVAKIRTKDILILDEPTDGFSTEQLDKIREVIDELKIRQIIIVSHESKIESFVDNVIKINKSEHVSNVL